MFLKKMIIQFSEADRNTDFAVMTKKMTLAKTLKNTWLAVFAEIIVSDKECLIFRNWEQALR